MIAGVRSIDLRFGRWPSLLVIALVLAPLLFLAWERHQIESLQNTVAIVLDGNEITVDLYPQMKAAGATGVALYEWTVQDALDSGDVFLLSSDALWTVGSSLAQHLPPLAPGELYLGWRHASERPTDDVEPPWTSRLGHRLQTSGSPDVVPVDAPAGFEVWRIGPKAVTAILRMPLGFHPDEISAALATDLVIFPRLLMGEGPFEGHVSERLATLGAAMSSFQDRLNGSPSMGDFVGPILFRGTRVIDPDQGPELLKIVESSKHPVGVIEFSPQAGLNHVVRTNGYRAVRVHSITDREMASSHMTQTRATERLMRAVHERSIRILYVRLFPETRFADGMDLAAFNVDRADIDVHPAGVALDAESDVSLDPLETAFIEHNVQYVANLARQLQEAGYTIGLPQPVSFPPMSWLSMFGVAVAVLIVGGVTGLLGGLFWRRFSFFVWIGVGATVASLVFWFLWLKGYTVPARQLFAFATAVIFPVVAIAAATSNRSVIATANGGIIATANGGIIAGAGRVMFKDQPGVFKSHVFNLSRHLWSGLRSFWVATGITLAGVLVLVGFLDDPRFMLKIEEFRGVKAAHVLPPMMVAAWLFAATIAAPRPGGELSGPSPNEDMGFQSEGWWAHVRRLLATKVSVLQLIIAGAAGALIGFYILRTGNDGVPVPFVELAFRRLLEENLWVRPRTKEFLIGHPALFLALTFGPYLTWHRGAEPKGVEAYQRPVLFGLLLLGTIGQLSILNTFAHVHVPVMVSVIRTFLGLGIGLVIGLVAAIIMGSLVQRYDKSFDQDIDQNIDQNVLGRVSRRGGSRADRPMDRHGGR